MMDKQVLFLENHDWTYSYEDNNAWCTQAIEILCAAMDGQTTEEEYNLVFNRK